MVDLLVDDLVSDPSDVQVILKQSFRLIKTQLMMIITYSENPYLHVEVDFFNEQPFLVPFSFCDTSVPHPRGYNREHLVRV